MKKLKILMIASEAVPFAKAGGLGDAVASLSLGLRRLGHDVRLVLPRYRFIDVQSLELLPKPLGVPVGNREYWTGVYRGDLMEARHGTTIPAYFIDYRDFFERPQIYGTAERGEYEDNPLRFGLLCRAAFQLCRKLHWIPDVLHAHDWPAALVPVYRRILEANTEFSFTATVLSIHNIGYQGLAGGSMLSQVGIPAPRVAETGLTYGDDMNLLKGGITCADALVTVSPRHAQEIKTPEHGFGLDGLLRARERDLSGIINGVDDDTWNPAVDPLLPQHFDAEDLANKAVLKRLLQLEMGLAPTPDVPLIGMVSRLAEQKGFQELCNHDSGILERMLEVLPIQLVLLGSGEPQLESCLRRMAETHANLAVSIGYQERLAHLIQAGSDFFLMPSRYEPCGLNQMYALRYGTIPIVTNTGGLADTVEPFDGRSGTGFLIPHPSPWLIFDAVSRATRIWREMPEAVTAMRLRGMQKRFPVENAATQYEAVYRTASARSERI